MKGLAGCSVAAAALALAPAAAADWGPTFTVTREARLGFELAPVPHGAIAVWKDVLRSPVDSFRTMMRRVDGTRPSRTKLLSSLRLAEDSYGLQVATSPSGAAVLVWVVGLDGGVQVWAQQVSARGRARRPRMIASERTAHTLPALVVDAAGTATIAWTHTVSDSGGPDGFPISGIRYRRLGASGSLGTIREVPHESAAAEPPKLAVEPSGRTAIAWVRSTYQSSALRAAVIDRKGRLGKVHDLSGFSFGYDIAVDRRGRATVVTCDERALVTRRLTGGAIGRPRTLAVRDDRGGPRWPEVEVDRRGNATFAWTLREGVPYPEKDWGEALTYGVLRQLRANGKLSKALVLPARSGAMKAPALASDGRSRTTAVWGWRSADGVVRIQARSFKPNGRLGALKTLATQRTGEDSYKVVADAASVVTAMWSPGDGTVSGARFTPRSSRSGHDRRRARPGL